MVSWLAIDIGGANLKVADGDGFAAVQAFSLWQQPEKLVDTLRSLFSGAPPSDHLAVTMTGELADCFATKKEGVTQILGAVERAADRRHTRVYRTDGTLVSLPIALREPGLVASANWHALARFAGRYVKQGCGLIVDIGSTTTDIIGLVEGRPNAAGNTDTERLLNGELVYTGVLRSPVAAIVDQVPLRTDHCPIAQELFANTLDVYVTLGNIPEDSGNAHTTDGRATTKDAARDRLARMVCADRDSFDEAQATVVAEAVRERQCEMIGDAAERVAGRLPAPPEKIILSGRGEFLARRALAGTSIAASLVSLAEDMDLAISICASAHALAVLARETTK